MKRIKGPRALREKLALQRQQTLEQEAAVQRAALLEDLQAQLARLREVLQREWRYHWELPGGAENRRSQEAAAAALERRIAALQA